MAVTYKGMGVVYIPERNRFVRFLGGLYTTADEMEQAVLSRKYEHDAPIADAPVADAPVDDKPKRGRPRNA
jgi:hypothetical protein